MKIKKNWKYWKYQKSKKPKQNKFFIAAFSNSNSKLIYNCKIKNY